MHFSVSLSLSTFHQFLLLLGKLGSKLVSKVFLFVFQVLNVLERGRILICILYEAQHRSIQQLSDDYMKSNICTVQHDHYEGNVSYARRRTTNVHHIQCHIDGAGVCIILTSFDQVCICHRSVHRKSIVSVAEPFIECSQLVTLLNTDKPKTSYSLLNLIIAYYIRN